MAIVVEHPASGVGQKYSHRCGFAQRAEPPFTGLNFFMGSGKFQRGGIQFGANLTRFRSRDLDNLDIDQGLVQ